MKQIFQILLATILLSNLSCAKNTKTKQDKTKTFIDSLEVYQNLLYPYNYINLDHAKYEMGNLLGHDNFYFRNHPDEEPTYTPTKIIFADGSEITAKDNYITPLMVFEKIEKNQKITPIEEMLKNESTSFKQQYIIKNKKPIKQIVFDVTIFTRKTDTIILNNINKKAETPYGTIYLDSIANNQVTINGPANMENNMVVYAKLEDGERVKNKMSNTMSITLGIDSDNTKTQIESNKYIYHFNKPVTALELVIQDTLITKTVYKPVYTLDRYRDKKDKYYTAMDFETQKRGVVNEKGEVIVPFKYKDGFRKINRFFYSEQMNIVDEDFNIIESYANTFWLNPKTEAFVKVDYELDDSEIYKEKYVTIETETNGPIGLLNAETGEIIIPMEHYNLRLEDDRLWITGKRINKVKRNDSNNGTGDTGAYDLNGKEVFPFIYNRITAIDNFTYTEIFKENQPDTEDVFDVEHRNLTKGKYNDIDGYFSDGLLLVSKEAEDRAYYYIDQKGNEKLHFSGKEYRTVTPFKNGLARIQKRDSDGGDGNYGFINNKGDVVIPYFYDDATDFLGKYAYVKVEQPGEYWSGFIDKNKKVVLEFPGDTSFSMITYDEDIKKYKILIKGDWYDFDGNKLDKE